MKTQLTTLITLIAGWLYADAIPVDFGPSRIVEGSFFHYVPTLGLNNTHLNGQTVPLDLDFGQHFVRLFTATSGLSLSLGFTLDGNLLVPSNFNYGPLDLGNGYYTDAQGQQIGTAIDLFGYFGSGSFNRPGNALTSMQLYALLPPDLQRPADLYGFHFDLTLPQADAFITEDGNPNGWRSDGTTYVSLSASEPHAVFGIGPDIPRDRDVPDGGSTWGLFLLGCLGLAVTKLVEKAAKETDIKCIGRETAG
jgi:hypothetical protein